MPFDLDVRIADWRKSLLDTTKRNRLIKFVASRGGGVNFTYPSARDLWARLVREGDKLTFPWKRELLGLSRQILDADTLASDVDPSSGNASAHPDELAQEFTALCLRSPQLRPTHLLTELTDRQLAARLLRLSRTSREAETDHGVTTLFAAFGFLRWFENKDSDEELLSPLLLVPVRLDRETIESPFTLHAGEEDVLPNYCLAEMLESQFRIKLPAAAEYHLDPENPDCLPGYLQAVAKRVEHVPRWGIVETSALGVFNFQKLAMWEDLGRNAATIKSHPLCRAVAGETGAAPTPPDGLPAASDLDRMVAPEAAVHILDADSSQHEAIEAVKRGADLVMDGPPGTGKSQTIANMIAEALAAGKTILFVSEKTAALEVVKRRLDRCGLGDFCLELHSHKASKKEVIGELGRCLDLTARSAPNVAPQLQELGDDRRKLNEFVTELHVVRAPLGWSAFRVHGELARIDRQGSGRSRLAIAEPFTRDSEYVRRGTEILAGLTDCHAVIDAPGGHPWRGCKLTTYSLSTRDDAAHLLGQLARAVPAARRVTDGLGELGILSPPFTVPGWQAAEADARLLLSAPTFSPEWFVTDPLARATAVVELDRATREARDLVSKLPEFDQTSVRALTDREEIVANRDRERLVSGPILPARERLAALVTLRAALRPLRDRVATIDKLARDVTGQLQLAAVPRFGELPDLALLAGRLASAAPIPRPWWEEGRRAELLVAVTRAGEDERSSQGLRPALVAKLSPVALAPESAPLAREAADAARSLWRWLPWSRWAKVRKQVETWYPSQTGASIRTDVIDLATYHRLTDSVRQVASAYAGEVWTNASARPDWSATATGLKDVEQLGQWKASAALQQASGPGGSIDRGKLHSNAERLAQETAAFGESWTAILKELAVPDVASALVRPSPEFLAWLEAESGAIEREAATLTRVVGLLTPGKDVPAAALVERVANLRQLVAARGQIATAADVLKETRSLEALEAVDHSLAAERGRSLLGFLSTWGRPVTPAVAAVLTQAAVRERLAAIVRQSESARPDFDRAWGRVTADLFDPDVEVSTKRVLNKTALMELETWAADRAADADRLSEWARFLQVEKDAAAFGLRTVIDEVKGGEYGPLAAANAFRARFYRLWLDTLHEQVPILGAFSTATQERLIARFAELDRLAIRATPDRVRSQLLTSLDRPRTREGAPETSELGILLHEVHKKIRHVPLRRLFAQIPSILPRIKPCLMMSPLAVSTYLDTPELTFDLVIFDEASQVRPHDAICAIYRGRQLVVGGDPKQLPPTDFFSRADDDDDDSATDDGSTSNYESLLDVCLSRGITRKRLRWHYRSRREGLIAFSNRYFYEGRLVTFPSADEATTPAITFVKVPDGRFKGGVNVVEAKRVAALVMEHAHTTPDVSLGVIAFSQRQQDRILDELESLRRKSPDVESFFTASREDPFFVKNLENVQGDERDAIVLDVGYGPDESGKVAMRFGPLNRQGGERRLNVAVTRARRSMTVVASMTAADVDLSRTSAEGAKLLRAFLDYAARGPVAFGELIEEVQGEEDSPLEQEVGDELARRGLTIQRQVGCGGYLVDLAITDPQLGGKYLLGVECDGATYHSAATARDRDRLRQAVLEGLGWRLIRVWSTDWVRDREKQVMRILAALEEAKNPKPAAPVRDSEPERSPVPRRRPIKVPEFEDIEAVPEGVVTNALVTTLTELGSMHAEDLIAAVSKRLGFKRTGPKIRERVTAELNNLVAAGRLSLGEDTRVKLKKANNGA